MAIIIAINFPYKSFKTGGDYTDTVVWRQCGHDQEVYDIFLC